MSNFTVSLFIIVCFFGIVLYMSQRKLRDKMLCTFIRPNKQKIEKWVPLDASWVIFDRGRYGIGRYKVNPDCIAMMWFDRGFNKFFPVLIPTMEFKWDSPNPMDPKTFQTTWLTPEAQEAGWEEHQHVAFAKATQAATTKKGRFPEWLFPLVTVGLVLIVLLVVWQEMGRIAAVEQQIKLLLP